MTAFVAFLLFSIVDLSADAAGRSATAAWLEPGRYPLPIQTSRILLYAGYFFAGVGVGAADLRAGLLAENGELAKRWPVWLAFALLFYGAILLLVYAHHNWMADFDSPPLWWRIGLWPRLCDVQRGDDVHGAGGFPALCADRQLALLDAMQPSAYGIYLVHLHLHHLAAIRRLRSVASRPSSSSRSCSPARFR